MHTLGRGRAGTKSMVATLVPGLGKCLEEWNYFLDYKEKIIGAWGLVHSRLSSSIEEDQKHVCIETDTAGSPDAMWHRVGCCFGVGRLDLQDFIGADAQREHPLDRGGLNRLSINRRCGSTWLWFPVPEARSLGLFLGLGFPF